MLKLVSAGYMLWLAWRLATFGKPWSGGRRGEAYALHRGGRIPVDQPQGLGHGADRDDRLHAGPDAFLAHRA